MWYGRKKKKQFISPSHMNWACANFLQLTPASPPLGFGCLWIVRTSFLFLLTFPGECSHLLSHQGAMNSLSSSSLWLTAPGYSLFRGACAAGITVLLQTQPNLWAPDGLLCPHSEPCKHGINIVDAKNLCMTRPWTAQSPTSKPFHWQYDEPWSYYCLGTWIWDHENTKKGAIQGGWRLWEG